MAAGRGISTAVSLSRQLQRERRDEATTWSWTSAANLYPVRQATTMTRTCEPVMAGESRLGYCTATPLDPDHSGIATHYWEPDNRVILTVSVWFFSPKKAEL